MNISFKLRSLFKAPEMLLLSQFTIILLLCFLPVSALANQKMILQKAASFSKAKVHPHTKDLRVTQQAKTKTKSANYNRLLVIMVEFEEELIDDPLTTGNGRFQVEADPDYLYSIGAPPHNLEYFEANLEAARYYYLAASAGYYDLEYDVYPKDGSYITLPKPMGYYNPPNASAELFTSLMEEYFYQSFSLADAQCPEIDFASYDHYMIIHAGSDWQHDMAGDTPSDIPSFFIHVDDSKAVPVNNGNHLISHACNVPSTISQDFTAYTEGGVTIHSGYGAINSVLVHEFGHSLGLVDLYNTKNFQPMVGVFDIMDSGGGGVLVDVLDDGSYVYVEGMLPVLPGAFSRALLFEDQFRAAGLMKDLDVQSLNTELALAASSFKQSGNVAPSIYKLKLSEHEYILLENRSVDPDDDGATAVYGALDGRVILYPTPINDSNNSPSYEYDYLLPSFQRSTGESEGGGILAWHINEDILYKQGVLYPDGQWVNNFDNNSVNASKTKPGVRIIEADGLEDIGNEWSWWWTGTQYEYFHKAKPMLDGNGNFVAWSAQAWKPELGPHTKPALTDSQGIPSFYWIKHISHPHAYMSFELEAGFFEESFSVEIGPNATIAPMINTSFGPNLVPIFTNDSIQLYSTETDPWYSLMGEFAWQSSQPLFEPIVSNQSGNPYDELVLCLEDRVRIVEFWNDRLSFTDLDLGAPCTLKPLAHDNVLYLVTEEHVFMVDLNRLISLFPITDVKAMAMAKDKLVLLHSSSLSVLSYHPFEVIENYSLPDSFGDYQPVIFTNPENYDSIIYLCSNSGNIYSVQDGNINRIFQNPVSELPTQLGIVATDTLSPILFWGLKNKVYATLYDGTMLKGFPYTNMEASFTALEHVYAWEINSTPIMQIPGSHIGFLAYGLDATYHPELSLGLLGERTSPILCYLPHRQKLYWYHQTKDVLSYHYSDVSYNPIHWAGERNGAEGQYVGSINYAPASKDHLSIFVYPNPVVSSSITVRADKLQNKPVDIKIFDSSGKLVHQQSFEASASEVKDFSFDHQLSNGIYYLTLTNKDKRARNKFAVIK